MSTPAVFRCDHPGCTYSSPKKAHYTQHVKLTHAPPGGYTCPMCGVKLKNRYYAEKTHINLCEGVHVGLEVSFTANGFTRGPMPDGFSYKRGRANFEVPDYEHQPFLPNLKERQRMEWGFAEGEWVPPKEEVEYLRTDSKGNEWIRVLKPQQEDEQVDAQPEEEVPNHFEEQHDQPIQEQQQDEQIEDEFANFEELIADWDEQQAQWVGEQSYLTQIQQSRAPYFSPYLSTYIGLPMGPHPSQQANPTTEQDAEMTDGDVDALFEDDNMDESY